MSRYSKKRESLPEPQLQFLEDGIEAIFMMLYSVVATAIALTWSLARALLGISDDD